MTIPAKKLVRMAEHIAENLRFSSDEEIVASKVTEHLTRFWDPRMKKVILDYASTEDAQLSSTLRRALAQLQVHSAG